MEKLNQRQVAQITTPDMVAGLGRFKGIDVSSSSLLTTRFSMRGFNLLRSEQIIQAGRLHGYAATQPEQLLGNILDTSALDVANGFNGVLLTKLQRPRPETVRLRGGNHNLLDRQL